MMASKFSFLLFLCIFSTWAIDFTNGASSPHIAPSPSVDCSTPIVSLSDCLSFVTNDSTITKPQGSCCSALKIVLKTAPSCLCEAFKESSQFGVTLNVSKALTLPSLCKLSAPPLSNCGLSVTPAAAPGVKISPGPSPTSDVSPGAATPVHAPSPAAEPKEKSAAASALLPISAGSFLVCFLSLFF